MPDNVIVKKKKRMLMLGDWHEASSGFGTVAKNILPVIVAHYGDDMLLTFVAINYFGEPYNIGNNVTVVSAQNYCKDIQVEKGDILASSDPFGRHSIYDLIARDEIGYDIIFLFQDIAIINTMIPTLKEFKAYKQKNNQRNFRTIIYTPIDYRLHKHLLEDMGFVDTIITYNEFSRKEIIRIRPDFFTKVKKIPHGVDCNEFYPMPDEEAHIFRKEFFGDNAKKIIFSNINRNQPRKAIGETILAFIEAKERWPDTIARMPFLYLHMLDKDPLMSGYDLKKIFEQTELVEGVDYKIAPQEFFTKENGADIKTLRSIYNATDVYITTSTGEGWGLTVTEAMACRKPVILPLHTSFIEISNDGRIAYAMQNLIPFINQFDSNIRYQADIYECADLMIEAAYKSISGEDKAMVDDAEKYVRSLSWRWIAGQFIKYFNELW